MKIATYNAVLLTLTALETEALKSAYTSSEGNGHDFGYTDDIVIPGKSKQAVGGVVSSLIKKGVIMRDDEFGQFAFLSFDLNNEKYEAAKIVATFLSQKAPVAPAPATKAPKAPKAAKQQREERADVIKAKSAKPAKAVPVTTTKAPKVEKVKAVKPIIEVDPEVFAAMNALKGGKRELIERALATRGVRVDVKDGTLLVWKGFVRKEAKVYQVGARAIERAVCVTPKSLTFVNPPRMVMESVAEFSPTTIEDAVGLMFEGHNLRPAPATK